MELEIFTTGAEDYGTWMKALIAGNPGAGKTLISSTFPNAFYASAEGGLMSVARRRVRGVEITQTEQLKEVARRLRQPPEVRADLLSGPVDTLVVDTIDEIQRLFIKERLAAKRIETMDMQSWGWLGDQMRAVLTGLRNLEMNVVFTCHLKETRDDSTGQVFYNPALQGAVGGEIAQYMDLALLLQAESASRVVNNETERYTRRFLQTFKDPQHDWIKDRSGQLPPMIEVNFEDDYERMNRAIYGWITEDWKREEARVVQNLETIADNNAPGGVVEAPEVPTGAPEGSAVPVEPTSEERLVEAASGAPQPNVVEGVEESSPTPVGEPVSVPVSLEKEQAYLCEKCGTEFDSQDQKELSDIMIHKIYCSPCYRAEVDANKKKKG